MTHSDNNDSNQPSNPDTAEKTSTPDPLEICKTELEKSRSEFLYLKAEFDTYRRNAIRERSDLVKYSGEKVLTDLLSIFDNFERALQTETKDSNFDSFRQGVKLIGEEFKSLFQRHGITEIPSQGVPFDPNVHEALSAEPTKELPPGHITRVFRKAFKYHDKLIRTGQVVVAQEPKDSEA
ncbi:MAG: nucleotide exchange factor GrpE [Bdellovibrionales bacterium]|nr:nucleotide exchange factor GrpE [Bdellovibrionales bacterium]